MESWCALVNDARMIDFDLCHRPERREDLAEWYAAALEDQSSSGLSVAEYARELGVTAATLYQWRRRLRSRPQAYGLVEVMPADGGPVEGTSSFIVHLGGDRRIEVPEGFDDSGLRRLVTVLESC